MDYKTVKYNSQGEALDAFKKMIQRKKEWISATEAEFKQLRSLGQVSEA